MLSLLSDPLAFTILAGLLGGVLYKWLGPDRPDVVGNG